jgi:hypothetical protein
MFLSVYLFVYLSICLFVYLCSRYVLATFGIFYSPHESKISNFLVGKMTDFSQAPDKLCFYLNLSILPVLLLLIR